MSPSLSNSVHTWVMESPQLGPRVKAFEEENDANNVTLGPSWGDSITKVRPEIERLSHIFAVTPLMFWPSSQVWGPLLSYFQLHCSFLTLSPEITSRWSFGIVATDFSVGFPLQSGMVSGQKFGVLVLEQIVGTDSIWQNRHWPLSQGMWDHQWLWRLKVLGVIQREGGQSLRLNCHHFTHPRGRSTLLLTLNVVLEIKHWFLQQRFSNGEDESTSRACPDFSSLGLGRQIFGVNQAKVQTRLELPKKEKK